MSKSIFIPKSSRVLFGKELRSLRTSSERFSDLSLVVALAHGKQTSDLPVGVSEPSSSTEISF